MDKEKLASFGIGIGTGLLIGGILGILYAPKSGKETRTIIRDKAVKVKDKVAGDIRAIRNKARIDDLKQS
jgi:gas vesicle protein